MGKLLRSLFVLSLFCCDVLGRLSYDYVTCGSAVKLLNSKHEVRLHSHDVKYGSGSGQQSVTGISDMDDHNSHWAIRGPLDAACKRGEPIKCGSMVRFQHMATGTLLHSHLFPSPLSRNQEVSCFGKDGAGDTGDYWELQCGGDFWERDEDVRLKHKDTGMFLATTGNRFGRPINGQNEICAVGSTTVETAWRAAEGVYIKPTEE